MNKDKIVLKDLTEIELEADASLSCALARFPDKTAMVLAWDKLTPDNLAGVQIKNGDGLVVGTYTELVLVSETSTVQADGSILTCFNLREKSDIEKLTERVAAVEEGQTVQDGAIMDVAEVVSTIAETQEGGNA